MSGLFKNIIIVGGIIVLGGLGYYLYTQNAAVENDGNDILSQKITAESEEFLRKLNELQAVQLDGSIFTDPRFMSLSNFASPLVEEPIGNSDPFRTGTNE